MTETVGRVSWIEETARAVGLARNADEAQKQADVLVESKAELDRLLSQFQLLRKSADVLRAMDWEGRFPSPELSRDLDEALRTLDSRPLNRVQRALDRFALDLAATLRGQWVAHASQRLGDVSDLLALSEILSGVEGIAQTSQELSGTLGELARSQSSLPTSQSVELLSKAERLLRQLESSLRPDGVRRFLSAVARGGAPVDSLTSDVTRWLTDHHSIGRFRIVAGSPVGDSHD